MYNFSTQTKSKSCWRLNCNLVLSYTEGWICSFNHNQRQMTLLIVSSSFELNLNACCEFVLSFCGEKQKSLIIKGHFAQGKSIVFYSKVHFARCFTMQKLSTMKQHFHWQKQFTVSIQMNERTNDDNLLCRVIILLIFRCYSSSDFISFRSWMCAWCQKCTFVSYKCIRMRLHEKFFKRFSFILLNDPNEFEVPKHLLVFQLMRQQFMKVVLMITMLSQVHVNVCLLLH